MPLLAEDAIYAHLRSLNPDRPASALLALHVREVKKARVRWATKPSNITVTGFMKRALAHRTVLHGCALSETVR